jgi:hypothetical protein
MSLYPPEKHNNSNNICHFLAIGSAIDVRLFTLVIQELNDKAITATIKVLYKVRYV